MDEFAALYERLDAKPDEADAARLLADYLSRTPDPDRGLALGLLLGALDPPRLSRKDLRALGERLDSELLAIAKETCGDEIEAIALMWPAPGVDRSRLSVSDATAQLAKRAESDTFAAVLDQLAPSARVTLLRLAAGRAKPLLDAATAHVALARLGAVEAREIEAVWHALGPPYLDLFAWLESRAPRPEPAARAAFRPLSVCVVVDRLDADELELADFAADEAWDGLRVLLVAEGGARRLYSKRGEDVSTIAPHVLERFDVEGEIEGVLTPDPRALSKAAAVGARFIAFDCLRESAGELRAAPFEERRAMLEALLGQVDPAVFAPTTLVRPADWGALEAARADARARGAEGLVLKRRDAAYPHPQANEPWRLWRCAPHTVDAVLMYVSGEWSSADEVATFGVWRGSELVPVAKVALSGDFADEIAIFVEEHAIARHGPVREVPREGAPALLARLIYAAAEPAPRRKAGVILKDARIASIDADASPERAGRLEDVLAPVKR
ncbi:MAG: hypothetical protein PVI23_12825 [Maricaulaceae bacterium]|jgi:DNA ligase-1